MNNGSVGTWSGGSNNANYYDNVLAFYNSTIDLALTITRPTRRHWPTGGGPCLGSTRAADCSDGDGTTCLFPRLQGVVGLMTRALDGRPDMWPGLRALIGWDYGFTDIPSVGDLREDSYATSYVALAALLDPDPASEATWVSDTTEVIDTLWAPNALAQGNWTNPSYGYASWNGSAGTVTVTNGSTTVIGKGTQWASSWFSGNAVWTANNNLTDGDAVAYTGTVVSATQLTLDAPYQGPTQPAAAGSPTTWWASEHSLISWEKPRQHSGTLTSRRRLAIASISCRYRQLVSDGRLSPRCSRIVVRPNFSELRADHPDQ